ncbi:MAG: type II secretion system minor pseudopilin GspK [Deltaproteobacteria bacterium]|nr:type II secretion system minor pseudopilin GspK [Deltaproteobacteria bacterium]
MILRDRSGMALLLTLLAVSFLVAVTVQLSSTVNWQMEAAHNLRDSVRLKAMVRSGLNLARAALSADQRRNKFDSLDDEWNHLDPATLSSLFGRGKLSVKVVDQSGLLQVNALVSQEKDGIKRRQQEKRQFDLWIRLLTSGRFAIESEDEAVVLVDSIKDWIDKDDEVRDHGAESAYYQGLDPPYSARNGPIEYPEELLLVRGMTRKLFYGDKEHAGLVEYLTIAGRDGKININTAPLGILQALAPGITKETAGRLIDFRRQKRNMDLLARPDWYRQVRDFPDDIVLDRNIVTVVSHCFLVSVTATSDDGMVRTGSGVIRRDDRRRQTLLYWKVE